MLTLNPHTRITAQDALKHDFFRLDPPACKPNELPTLNEDYHEYIVKAAKKQKAPIKRVLTLKKSIDYENDPQNQDFWKDTFISDKVKNIF